MLSIDVISHPFSSLYRFCYGRKLDDHLLDEGSALLEPFRFSRYLSDADDALTSISESTHLSIQITFSLEADARKLGQHDVAVVDFDPVGEPAIRLKEIRVRLVASEPQAGRNRERHLVAAMRHTGTADQPYSFSMPSVRRFSTSP